MHRQCGGCLNFKCLSLLEDREWGFDDCAGTQARRWAGGLGGGGGQWRCGWAVDAPRIALRLTGDLVKERGCKRRQKPLAVCWRTVGTTESSELRADVHRAGPAANLFAPQMIACSPAATHWFLFLCLQLFIFLQTARQVSCAAAMKSLSPSRHNPVKSCKDSAALERRTNLSDGEFNNSHSWRDLASCVDPCKNN